MHVMLTDKKKEEIQCSKKIAFGFYFLHRVSLGSREHTCIKIKQLNMMSIQ